MKRKAWFGLGGVAAWSLVACGGTVNLHEEELTAGGSPSVDGILGGMEVGGTAPGFNSSAGTASTLSGGSATGPGMPTGGAIAIGGTAIAGGAPGGGTASGGTMAIGGTVPVAGTAPVGGTAYGGATAGSGGSGGEVAELDRCLQVGGPYGCCDEPLGGQIPPVTSHRYFEDGHAVFEACDQSCGALGLSGKGPIGCEGTGIKSDLMHSTQCGRYMIGDQQDCSALGQGPTGETFACGDAGLRCESGKFFCQDSYGCVRLPVACTSGNGTCSCYESIYGESQMTPGGWYCTDLGPGAFAITTVF